MSANSHKQSLDNLPPEYGHFLFLCRGFEHRYSLWRQRFCRTTIPLAQMIREKTMPKSIAPIFLALALLCTPLGTASAQDGPVAEALKDCSNEIETYCSSVTPGGGRLVSCAKAHEDKLSSQCISAINRAGYWVSFLANTLAYVVLQCEADARKFCPDVELGEERVLNCLSDNRANLSKYCGLALNDVGRN